MLSHNATTKPSALDPSVLLKHYLRTRDGVRLYPLFNRWHIVVWNEQTDPFLHSSLLFPASCLCIELKLNEVHLALHPVCVENSFSFYVETTLPERMSREKKTSTFFWESENPLQLLVWIFIHSDNPTAQMHLQNAECSILEKDRIQV